MKNISRQVSLLAVSVITALSLAAVPAGAEQETGSSGSPNTTTPTSHESTTETHTTTSGITTGSKTETETSDSTTSGEGGSLSDQAKQLLETKRQGVKEHTATERKDACEQRQKSIDNRTSDYAAAAGRHLENFNDIFTKVKAFHDSKQLNVSNYDTLVAAATAKQAAAQSAVDALKALNVQIDCTQPDPAGTVAAIKTAVLDARTALQNYRSALKDLVVALKGASTASTNASTTGGNQ